MATPRKKPEERERVGRKPLDANTDEELLSILSKLEAAFSMGCTDAEACIYADISPAALYRYEKANPAFRERKHALKEKPVLLARKVVIDAIQGVKDKEGNYIDKPDADLAFKYLERKKRDEFAVRTQMELKEVEAFDTLTDTQLQQIADGAQRAKEE